MSEGRDNHHGYLQARAISSIWRSAGFMFIMCIPLCAILKSPYPPMIVAAGAAVGTLFVLAFGDKPIRRESKSVEQMEKVHEKTVATLQEKIDQLESRLENVEVINRFEDRLAEKEVHVRSLDSESA